MRAPSVIKGMSAHLGNWESVIKLQSYPIATKMTISYVITVLLEYYTSRLSHSLNVDDKVEVEVVPPDCALNVVVRTGKKNL